MRILFIKNIHSTGRCVLLMLLLLVSMLLLMLLQLDAAGYKSLISSIRSACDSGDLSPPTLCRLGFHSVQIAAAVGRGYGANGGFHAFAVDYAHPNNGGMGADIAYLLKVTCGEGCMTHALRV